MSDSIFVDTNILVYAYDSEAGERHLKARQLVAELWRREVRPHVSVQVLQEFYVNMLRKKASRHAAGEAMRSYSTWQVIETDMSLLITATDITEAQGISLWDALIIAAARRAGAKVLWSEDLNAGQDYGGVVVVNPLAANA